jgi:hypothetical protein
MDRAKFHQLLEFEIKLLPFFGWSEAHEGASRLMERPVEDSMWLLDYRHSLYEIAQEKGVPRRLTNAINFGSPLSVIKATLKVAGVTPGAVCSVVRDLFGNPFRQLEVNPFWLRTSEALVWRLAEDIYCERAFDRLPILADALEEAACEDEALLSHCRSPGKHFRGCWAIDRLLRITDARLMRPAP